MTTYTIVVTENKKGKLITSQYSTNRDINIQNAVYGKTLRETTTKQSVNYDTSRTIHNYHNIEFDTARKLGNNIQSNNDTKRYVNSEVEVCNHSLFLYNQENKMIECAMFNHTDLFPYPDKYITVLLDNGITKYIPLAPVGDDFDSGGRFTLDNGDTYQICSNIIVNIINSYFLGNNYLVNLNSLNSAYYGLFNIFHSYVTKDDEYIYLRMPHKYCGITKIFVMGLWIEITNTKTNITYNTFKNGLCKTSYGGDNKYKANAMLLELSPQTTYKIKILNQYKKIKYDDDMVKGMLIMGTDVEELDTASSSYSRLINTNSYCTHNDVNILGANNDYTYKTVNYAKEHWLNYPHSTLQYNYFKL